jgi:S1-C subfamily serine protease
MNVRMFRRTAILAAFLQAILVLSQSAGVESLSYEAVKKQFESDEKLESTSVVRLGNSDIVIRYHGRDLYYRFASTSEALRSKIDSVIAREKDTRRVISEKENEEAAKLGLLREVDGVTYNLNRPDPGWVQFANVEVLQKIDEGVLVNVGKSGYTIDLILVKNLPQYRTVADNDHISFWVRQTGSYTYLTYRKVDKTVRQFDCGTIPGRGKPPSLVKSTGPTRKDSLLDASWDSSGTGFFITDDGYVGTCNHVVENGKRFSIKTAEGIQSAKVVATDKINDVALLKVDGKFSSLSINSNAVKLGDSVFTIGFPNLELQGLSPKYTDGKISSLAGVRDDDTRFQISVPVQPGNSGGPLTDPGGNLIGVVVSRLNDYAVLKRMHSLPQNVNYAVKIAPLIKLIKSSGLENKVRFSSEASGASNAIDKVQRATALVLVRE